VNLDAGELLPFARDELLHQAKGARKRIWLCSPFLTAGIAKQVAEASESSSAQDKRLLTALVSSSVQVGVLDPNGLSKLREGGFEIASIPNLHAKVSLVDSSWGLVGSGNLTNAGLGSGNGANVELGVVLSEAQIARAEAYFDDWWDRAKTLTEQELEEFAALPRISRPTGKATSVGTPLEISQSPTLEEILAEDEQAAGSRRYWIKSNYHQHDDERWWRREWISDRQLAPYEIGDLIFLYLSGQDGGPANCPAVVRATTPSRPDREWVLEHRDPAAAERWPYVTETLTVAEVPIASGVPLETIGKSGQSVQSGYCSISREQFELMARAMLA
jgi:hypothetical protein